ncbi:MAG: phosphodiester glycosidase family protein [Luteolibacter sp.]
MKHFLKRTQLPALLALLSLTACQPTPPPSQTSPTPYQAPAQQNPSLVSPTPQSQPRPTTETKTPTTLSQPTTPNKAPSLASRTIAGIRFDGVAFDSRTHHLRVIDQTGGPGSRYSSSQQLAGDTGALLAINAGFFTPEGKPLGLVISSGTTTGSWNSASSLGSGIFRENSGGALSISRRSSRSSVSSSRELLQAGPLLVENASLVSGLNSDKSAVRSIILTDGRSRFWIGKTSSCSLASLGKALASSSPAPWPVRQALNLDGGRSTDLYISGKIKGGSKNFRSFLNRPVRNFLILTPR